MKLISLLMMFTVASANLLKNFSDCPYDEPELCEEPAFLGIRNRIKVCDFEQAEQCGLYPCYLPRCIIATRDAIDEGLYYQMRYDTKAEERWRQERINENVAALYRLGPRNNRTSQCLGSGVNCQTAPNACCVKDSCHMHKGRGEYVCW